MQTTLTLRSDLTYTLSTEHMQSPATPFEHTATFHRLPSGGTIQLKGLNPKERPSGLSRFNRRVD